VSISVTTEENCGCILMQFTEEICDNVEMKKQLVLGDVPLRFRILCIVDLNDFLLWSAEI